MVGPFSCSIPHKILRLGAISREEPTRTREIVLLDRLLVPGQGYTRVGSLVLQIGDDGEMIGWPDAVHRGGPGQLD